MATATLKDTVFLTWTTPSHREDERAVPVTYTYDGKGDLRIVECDTSGICAIEGRALDLIEDALWDVCDDSYSDWLDGQSLPRAAESYIPMVQL